SEAAHPLHRAPLATTDLPPEGFRPLPRPRPRAPRPGLPARAERSPLSGSTDLPPTSVISQCRENWFLKGNKWSRLFVLLLLPIYDPSIVSKGAFNFIHILSPIVIT